MGSFGWNRGQPVRTNNLRDGEWSFRNGHTIDQGVNRQRKILTPSEEDF